MSPIREKPKCSRVAKAASRFIEYEFVEIDCGNREPSYLTEAVETGDSELSRELCQKNEFRQSW